MSAVHFEVLSMPLPSLDALLEQNPDYFDQGITLAQAADFIGVTPQSLRAMKKRGIGPAFTQLPSVPKPPKDPKEAEKPVSSDGGKLLTTRRRCIEFLNSDHKPAKRLKRRLAKSARKGEAA